MLKQAVLVILLFCWVSGSMAQQEPPAKYNPLLDFNLSPAHNKKINPLFNSSINPQINWNINPLKNIAINPAKNEFINPKSNAALNPNENKLLNPMFANSLHPQNPTWKGHYLFDKDDKLIGFITVASQEVMLCFDMEYKWTCFYIRSSTGNFNQFSLSGEWTGGYLSHDSSEGLNEFSPGGEWTGNHIL